MKKEDFVTYTDNWGSHRPLLWHALEEVKHLGLPVLELGCGDNSTPFLRQYCKDNKLILYSYDSKLPWAEKFGAIYVDDWDSKGLWHMDYGVVLLDLAPGEYRKTALKKLHHVRIVVAHDVEVAADHGYKMRAELFKYKYHKEHITSGAGTMAVSDYFDVGKWKI